MNEIKFEEGSLSDGSKYEWAKRSVNSRTDLIIHFFLGKKGPSAKFFELLKNAAIKCISKDCGVETAYAEDFDGHDIVVFGVEGWKAKPIKNALIKEIEAGL